MARHHEGEAGGNRGAGHAAAGHAAGARADGTLIADIILQLLSYVAEQERSFIRQRQAEGIAAAKARGQRFGPPPKQRPEDFGEYVRHWKNGTLSAREASRQLQIAHSTFLKWARG